MLNTILAMCCALLLDRLLGEPHRFHPLAGFGKFASWLESYWNKGNAKRLRGIMAWLVALAPCGLRWRRATSVRRGGG